MSKAFLLAAALSLAATPVLAFQDDDAYTGLAGAVTPPGGPAHGFTQYRPNYTDTLPDGTKFDLRGHTWSFNNRLNDDGAACNVADTSGTNFPVLEYPISIDFIGNIVIAGGKIEGVYPMWQDLEYVKAYCYAPALSTNNDTYNVEVKGIRIRRAWDGLDLNGVGMQAGRDGNYNVHDIWISDNIDDGIQDDSLYTMTLADSLIESRLACLSANDDAVPDASARTVTIDGLLCSTVPGYIFERWPGVIVPDYQEAPLKLGTNSPKIKITNSVFAFSYWHASLGFGTNARWDLIWSKINADGTCANNTLLWLSDAPPPWSAAHASNWAWGTNEGNGSPAIPGCFTLKAGRAAREHWETVKARWIREHPTIERFADDPVGRM